MYKSEILLKNASFIITMDDKTGILTDSDIIISGNRIASIGKNLKASKSAKILDCKGCLVIPGFINLHHHLSQSLTRNIRKLATSCLFDWLSYLYPVWAKFDEEAIYVASLVAMGELLLSGCTTTVDHHYVFPKKSSTGLIEAEIEAACKIGIRFHPMRGSMSRGKSKGGLPPDDVVQGEDEILNDTQRLIEKFNDPSDFSMVRVGIAPCSPFSITFDLLKQSAKLARDKGVLLHTHLSETEDEIKYCNEIYGMRPVALMEKAGWLGNDVLFAHCVHVDKSEIKLIASTETGVAHCPSSNLRLSSGIAHLKEMLDCGVRVGLAVDGCASNDTSGFVSELRIVSLIHRIRKGIGSISHEDILKMATVTGSNILGRYEIGKIKPDMAADIAVFRIDDLTHAGGLDDPNGILLLLGNSQRAEYVACNGRIVVEKGHLTGIDEEKIVREANEISKRLISG